MSNNKGTMKSLLSFGLVVLLNSYSFGQDTLRFNKKPEVIIKSWYPEFKEYPKLKFGEPKILYTKIPDFENMLIRNNDINLIVKNDFITIVETEKTNQYLVTINKSDSTFVNFEVWMDIGKFTILFMENSKWIDIKKIYPLKNNRVLLQTVTLEIEN
jgi:hypothetical protein